MTQMEHWSILSNVLNYVQHSRFHLMDHTLDIKAVNRYKHKPNMDDKEFKELDLVQHHKSCKKNTWTYMREYTQK